jgi:hypothetical protein
VHADPSSRRLVATVRMTRVNASPAPTGRPRWRRYVVAGVVVWILLSLGGLAVFVASLNTDSDIEEALNEKYDADITFERYRRQQELTIDGRESACRVEGEIGNLDDVRLVCTPREDTPPLSVVE